MKTYTLTESELQELLRQQREKCANAWRKIFVDITRVGSVYETYYNAINTAPSPPLPEAIQPQSEDEIKMWYDFLSGKGEIAANIACFITDAKKEISRLSSLLPAEEVVTKEDWCTEDKHVPGCRCDYVSSDNNYPKKDASSLSNQSESAPVSDTTEADSSNADGNKKIPSIDWEGLEDKFLVVYSITSNGNDIFNWLKTNLQDYIK